MKLKIKNGEVTGFSHDEKIVTIPDWVFKIGNYAFSFYRCENPTIIVIPDSVTSIGEYAFYRCENLTVRCHKGSYAEKYCIDNEIEYEIMEDYIPEENSPSDAETVENIKCKDCRFYNSSSAYCYAHSRLSYTDYLNNDIFYFNVDEDNHCWMAKRKDTDNDI